MQVITSQRIIAPTRAALAAKPARSLRRASGAVAPRVGWLSRANADQRGGRARCARDGVPGRAGCAPLHAALLRSLVRSVGGAFAGLEPLLRSVSAAFAPRMRSVWAALSGVKSPGAITAKVGTTDGSTVKC